MGQDGTERKLGAGPHRPPFVPESEWSNIQAHRFDLSPLPMVRSGSDGLERSFDSLWDIRVSSMACTYLPSRIV